MNAPKPFISFERSHSHPEVHTPLCPHPALLLARKYASMHLLLLMQGEGLQQQLRIIEEITRMRVIFAHTHTTHTHTHAHTHTHHVQV